MDTIDRTIINEYQGGFPISPRPYAEAAARLGIEEQDFIDRLQALLNAGTLSRFGPMYHAEKLGGGLTLAALAVPEEDFDAIAETVNAFPEVAHNYAREHHLNMWFVLATETPERIDTMIAEIEQATGLVVHNMPKETEFFVGLRFEA
jgi:siroheme decarboxylase